MSSGASLKPSILVYSSLVTPAQIPSWQNDMKVIKYQSLENNTVHTSASRAAHRQNIFLLIKLCLYLYRRNNHQF